jgi:ferrous iron transport protein B
LTGLLLKSTLFKGEASHFVMELPNYSAPRIRHILIHTWNRLKQFMFRAGKVIIVVVTVLSFLNSMGTDGSFGNEDTDKSVLAKIGDTITPIFAPMGVERENWPASVAIFSGIFAKEAVVGTLNSLYSQIDKVREVKEESKKEETSAEVGVIMDDKANELAEDNESLKEEESYRLFVSLIDALKSIPENLSGIFKGFADPFGMAVLEDADDMERISEGLEVDSGAFASMKRYFSRGRYQAYAFLLFILIYFPCVAVLGVLVREVGSTISAVIVTYLTILGWIVSTLFYQIVMGHSILWICICSLIIVGIYASLRLLSKTKPFRGISSAGDITNK